MIEETDYDTFNLDGYDNCFVKLFVSIKSNERYV